MSIAAAILRANPDRTPLPPDAIERRRRSAAYAANFAARVAALRRPSLGQAAAYQANRIQRRIDANRRGWRTYRARQAGAVCDCGPGCFANAALRMRLVCRYCQATRRIQADHIIPLSRGGLDCRHNLQPLCRACNARKGAAMPSLPFQPALC